VVVPERGHRLPPRWPFATLGRPIYPRHPYLPKGAKGPESDAQHRVGQLTTQRPQVRARQAPRVKSVLSDRGWLLACSEAEERAAALAASLKSLQQPRLGWSGEKRRPICGGYIDRRPYLTLGTLAAPIYLATLPAQAANGPESEGARSAQSLDQQRIAAAPAGRYRAALGAAQEARPLKEWAIANGRQVSR